MRVLHRELRQAGVEVLETVYGNTWLLQKSYPDFRRISWQQADLIIVNGEGTMHDDARLAVYYMEEVLKKCTGKKVAFVNTLWQRMSTCYADILKHVDLVAVREPLSHRELGLDSAVMMPDLSYYEVPIYGKLPDQGFLKGTFYGRLFGDLELNGTIDITREDWGVTVNKLRHAKACLTGKHHEVIACCIARCPFVTTPVDTHKISGLGDYIGVKLPQLDVHADVQTVQKELVKASEDVNGIYSRLFQKMESIRAMVKLKDLIETAL
jgi:hypothetical protein